MAQLIKIIFLLVTTYTPYLHAAVKKVDLSFDANQSSAEFLAVGRPSMIKIKGKGAQVSGQAKLVGSALTGELKLDLDQFDTGIETRNKHMKEKYLETGKPENKFAILELKKIEGIDSVLSPSGEKKSLPFEGTLTFHGVKKVVNGLTDIKWQDHAFDGASTFKVKLSEFNIGIPSFAGITVAEDVDVSVKFKGKIVTVSP